MALWMEAGQVPSVLNSHEQCMIKQWHHSPILDMANGGGFVNDNWAEWDCSSPLSKCAVTLSGGGVMVGVPV